MTNLDFNTCRLLAEATSFQDFQLKVLKDALTDIEAQHFALTLSPIGDTIQDSSEVERDITTQQADIEVQANQLRTEITRIEGGQS
jgi:hypothetical protein